jgi:hypothetical protein
MPISFLIFYTRRPDVSPANFRSYMEEKHVPLLKEIFKTHLPLSYTLQYPARVDSGAGDRLGAVTSSRGRADPDAPVVIVGSPSNIDWDCVGEMTFRDELHVQQCWAAMDGPEGQRAKEDEENFTVPERLRVVLMGESTVLM